MRTCPRCQATIELTTLQCPRCQLPLKAHGHPGIPLYRAEGEAFLCATCRYEADNSCNFPQRPYAQTCTLYRSTQQPLSSEPPPFTASERLSLWLRGHQGLLALGALLLFSLVLVLWQR